MRGARRLSISPECCSCRPNRIPPRPAPLTHEFDVKFRGSTGKTSQDKAADAIAQLATDAIATDASVTGTIDVPALPAIVTDNRAVVLQQSA